MYDASRGPNEGSGDCQHRGLDIRGEVWTEGERATTSRFEGMERLCRVDSSCWETCSHTAVGDLGGGARYTGEAAEVKEDLR